MLGLIYKPFSDYISLQTVIHWLALADPRLLLERTVAKIPL